ncbi:hypothetical protein [Streptomyces sp. NBC_00576]|nr:hypothetical protein [Streptomyces sp. NBC_00576]WUB73506.1 hypothetical protein OG734_27420 [Streptomyces sp. NBC_00576]
MARVVSVKAKTPELVSWQLTGHTAKGADREELGAVGGRAG